MSDTPQETGDDLFVRPFADFLREQSKGRTHDELSEALNDLVTAVTDTRRAGTLTLTISVKPLKGTEHGLLVGDVIKTKLPTPDRTESIFYAHDGNLQRTDPNQPEISGLREVGGVKVDTRTGELKEKKA